MWVPAGGVASVRAGSWLVAPVTGGCCASPSATSWSGAGSSGTAPPCYCSLQVCRVEWQEKRQGWLVALVGREQEEKAKIILSFVFLDISLLLHSPTQDTEVWCAPPPGGGRNLQAVLPVWLWPAPTAGHHLLQAAAALYRDQPAGGLLPSCLSCSPTAPAWPPLCYSCWGGPSWTLPTAPPPPRGNIF